MHNPMTFAAALLPPRFDSVEAERAHVKQHLAAAMRVIARLNLFVGVAGHLSARDPGRPDHFWVNAFGCDWHDVRPGQLSLVRHDGHLAEGDPVNAAAFAIHGELHRRRPDVQCIVHGHPVHGTAWASLSRPLDPINQDVCAFFEDHAVFGEATGIVLEGSESARIADALGGRKAAILRNHGLLTVGRTVDEALWWFVLMDRSCQIQLLAQAAGTPHRIGADEARSIAARIGTPEFGWFQCQPLIARELAALREPEAGR